MRQALSLIQNAREYCKERGWLHIADKAFHYYEAGEWVDKNGAEIKNWKRKLISVWFDEKKNPRPKDTSVIWEATEEQKQQISKALRG